MVLAQIGKSLSNIDCILLDFILFEFNLVFCCHPHRFYLGHWQEGIGKLFSFGGLGVWTLIDVILISLHYLGPADGSLYI